MKAWAFKRQGKVGGQGVVGQEGKMGRIQGQVFQL
jgi:hypothetical protein